MAKAVKRKKSATLNLRIDPELKARAETKAAAERLTVTVYVERLIDADTRPAPKAGRR